MRQKKEDLLFKKYPLLLSRDQRAMQWGFGCGDGWLDLIDKLCWVIQHHVDLNNATGEFSKFTPKEPVPQPVVEQIKEKFGGLRFYMRNADGYSTGASAMAEAISFRTCEECGASGYPLREGRIRTLCGKHHIDRNERMQRVQEKWQEIPTITKGDRT